MALQTRMILIGVMRRLHRSACGGMKTMPALRMQSFDGCVFFEEDPGVRATPRSFRLPMFHGLSCTHEFFFAVQRALR
jgi:hypothetical protein